MPLGESISLGGSQTLDIVDETEPEKFWGLLPDADLSCDKSLDPWNVDLVRYYFFTHSRLSFDTTSMVDFEKTRRAKKTVGVEGFRKDEPYIALDIRYHPVVSSNSYHAKYGDSQLFPRWSGLGHMSRYYPYIFNHRSYLFYYRAEDLADFGLYDQYDEEGRNRFLEDHYSEEWEESQTRKNVTKWKHGWPDWRIKTWRDAYGYSWIRFEPDHHCLSGAPVFWLVKWYELTGEEKYLDAAYKFLYYQVPRFGFHKGTWKGVPYYWTGYDPGYPSFPLKKELHATQDQTNNIQALVAKGLAAVGYHKEDKKMLELARGLLWYMCRSFEIDGRWYYHGPENPLAYTKAVSHISSCVESSMYALVYLYKAGVDVDQLVKGLEPAIKLYATHWPDMESREVPKPLKPVPPDRLITAYKMMSTSSPEPGCNMSFATIFQVRLDNATEVWFADEAPEGFESSATSTTLKLSVWKKGRWSPMWEKKIKAEDIASGVKVLEMPSVYDIYKVEYGPLKPRTSEFNVPYSTINVITSSGEIVSKRSATQQPEHHMAADPAGFLDIIALINFPKHPTDPAVVGSRKNLNLSPKPLVTSEEKAKFVSQEAKEAIDKALEEWEDAQAAFEQGRLEEAKNHLEALLNLINEASLLESKYFERNKTVTVGTIIVLFVGGILAFLLKSVRGLRLLRRLR